MRLSLRKKISGSAAVALIVVGSVVAWLAYSAAMGQMESRIQSQVQGISNTFSQYVSDWFISKGRALESFPGESLPASYITHLNQVKRAADVDNVFLGFEDGGLVNAKELVLPDDNNDPRVWSWYIHAKERPNQTVVEDPSVASATGKNVVSLGRVVNGADGQVLGVIGADVVLDSIVEQLRRINLPGNGSMFIAKRKGTVFAHSNQTLLNAELTSIAPALTNSYIGKLLQGGDSIDLVDVEGEAFQVFAAQVPNSELILLMMLNRDALVAPVVGSLAQQLMVILLLVAISIVALNWLIARLFIPLHRVSDALREIASGGGDLTRRLPETSKDEVGSLAHSFNQFVEHMHDLVEHIRLQATELDANATATAGRASGSVREMLHQREQIDSVTGAMSEMTSAIGEIAHHAENTANSVQEVVSSAGDGKTQVDTTTDSINTLAQKLEQAGDVVGSLNDRVQEINGILATIQGIAEQTNLLALNAAIEAARAGEQGRGFAVVADEVRVLSQRTHASTEEIQGMISALHDTSKNAVTIMASSRELAAGSVTNAQSASKSLITINDAVAVISAMATQIATAAEQQSHTVQEVMQNMQTISDVAERSLGEAEQGQSRAKVLKEHSEALTDRVATFRL
ncbi:methyl-accepting chemotaxis protein [Gilvimarinus polysaccharolyticus]|uniref:methyl-accepting chemotaxis protein n=1 Tax=Gilvimarinus polysaccharolyticus TaxID=863921 RepID=UPI0006734D7D|nr:methyl-accepting chemotaxis protein [Gilvimarinus polysaccharolyticus]